MTLMELRSQGPKITLADIGQFEREFSFVFPDAFRRFLLAQNGGFPTSRIGLKVDGEVVVVSNFLPLHRDDYGLRGTYRRIGDDGLYPIGIRPIGFTAGGVAISIGDARSGGSVFLTEYSYDDDNPVRVNVTPLADSFEEFLSRLELIEEEEEKCPIKILAKNGTQRDLDAFLLQNNSIDSRSLDGNSLLCEAILHENNELIGACIAAGANLRGAISAAIQSWSPDVLEQLIKAGADVEEQDESGRSPRDDIGGTEFPGYIGEVNRQLEKILLDAISAKRRRKR